MTEAAHKHSPNSSDNHQNSGKSERKGRLYNICEKRAIEFIYCSIYIPEIDDALSHMEYQREKMFWSSVFDLILLPIGFYMLYKGYRHFLNSKGASHSLNKGCEVNPTDFPKSAMPTSLNSDIKCNKIKVLQ